jgi:hypothetical protein
MSMRPQLKPQVVVNAAAMTADVYSSPSNINGFGDVSYNLNWTGTPTGTFLVEVCNDYVPSPPGVIPKEPQSGSWVALTLSTSVTASGSAGIAAIDIVGTSFAWIRLHYVFTSGTGALTATVAGKAS